MWKDFKWVEKRFGTKFANILKRVKDTAEEGGQEISNHFITSETGEVTFKDLDDNNHVLVTTEALQNEDSPVKELFDESVASLLAKNGLIEVKWQELKDKRDNGQLIPGSLYRITDYNCTTTQENTQSAGHQFDIVLLALSENKLAEEGWAMEHPTDVYDVTFSDGVTKKCYLNVTSKNTDETATYENWNVVDVNTMLGVQLDDVVRGVQAIVDDNTKTIVLSSINSSSLIEENLTYNYFQNSNLSAWKVWYCLDNDKSRFAWADDSMDEDIPMSIYSANNNYYRNAHGDYGGKYAWKASGNEVTPNPIFTDSLTPTLGDTTYKRTGIRFGNAGTVESYTPKHKGASKKEGIEVRITAEPIGEYTCVSAKYFEEVPDTMEIGGKTYYLWSEEDDSGSVVVFTLSETPKENDKIYVPIDDNTVLEIGYIVSYQPEHLVYNGRGVIYRLIDEWNNDVAYDFKNIQFAVPLTDGVYDPHEGIPTFVYTLTAFDEDSGNYIDISLSRAWDCKIGYYYDEQMNLYGLPPNICFNNASQIEIGNNCFHIILNDCANVSIGSDSFEVILTSIYKSSFGKQSANIRDLTPDMDCLNYGNGGVELATKNDLN